MSPNDPTPMPTENKSHKVRNWSIAVILVIVVAIGGFIWWFFSDDAPAEVSLDDAASQVVDTTADTAADSSTDSTATGDETTTDSTSDEATVSTDSEAADDTTGSSEATAGTSSIDGTWSVDTSIGEFSYEDSTGTFVGFRIEEELTGIGSTTAVGRTPAVSGTLTVDGSTITEVSIEADMTQITTNESRRNDKVQSALDTGEFPSATFVLTSPIELPDGAADGEQIDIDAIGDLTIHGVTTSVTFPLQAQLVGDTIVVVGQLEISFADYGVEVPSSPIVVSAEDHGPIELQLFFTR